MNSRFIETSIAKDVHDTVAYSRAMKRAALIVGPAGIGKTTALRHLADADNAAMYVTVSTAHGMMKPAYRLISATFGLGHYGRESSASLWEGLEEVFADYGREEMGPYLLIDEAQNLDLHILKELVDVPERFGFPVIACGNHDVLKRRRIGKGAFEQIMSRCAKQLYLDTPLEKDFRAIAMEFDAYDDAARDAVISFGKNTSIRELFQLLEAARAAVGNGPIKLGDLREAAVVLKGGVGYLKRQAA